MAKRVIADETGAPREPTDEEIESGQWQQPPQRMAQVVVPEGVFARLDQARKEYEELTEREFNAYERVAEFTSQAAQFARKGDMTPEAATQLATAVASKVFDYITVYVPPTKLEKKLDPAIIGQIKTDGDKVRYFRINPPRESTWATAQVVKQLRGIERAKWWDDSEHVFGFVMAIVAVILAAIPVILAIVYANPAMLVWLLAALILWLVIALIASTYI